jgi:PAS domain S-box-containing protein
MPGETPVKSPQQGYSKTDVNGEDSFEAILDSIADGISVITREMRISYANSITKRLFGPAIIGNLCHWEYHGTSETCTWCPAAKTFEDGKIHTIEVSNSNGMTWEITSCPLFDSEGLVQSVIEITRDISSRKKTEAALQESEEKYRTLIESINDVIYTTDENGVITYVSPVVEVIGGYHPSELVGRAFTHFVYPEDLPAVMKDFEKVISGQIAFSDFRVMTKSGDALWVHTSSRRVLEGDKFVGLRGTLTDITEKKRLESRLVEAQKMEAIGTLAGGVAHDLNNMLVGLVSYPELLLIQIPQDSPLREPLLTIQKSGEKAAAMVQDLLTMARRGVVVPDVLKLNRIISEYLESPEHQRVQFYHPRVKLETDLEPNLPNIMGSPIHLAKTVMNLVSNAAEAMPDGGSILISTASQYLDRPVQGYDHIEEGEYVTLAITDTGVGISPEDVRKIFEPFFTKKVMGRSGTGLGMAVVWWTVRDHNGYIDVQSTKGKGTTVTLYFPATRKELAQDERPLPPNDYMGKRESILIVDDAKEQREIASAILKKLGYSVASVSSGEEAVSYMKKNAVDLLILDMVMDPGIDGLETYERILGLHPRQKAILVSGYSETDRVKRAQELGAGAYVRKPYSLERIGLAVRAELERR